MLNVGVGKASSDHLHRHVLGKYRQGIWFTVSSMAPTRWSARGVRLPPVPIIMVPVYGG